MKIKIQLDKLIILDIETLCNCFMVCARDYKSGQKKEFIIFDDKRYDDQPFALYKFLRSCQRDEFSFVTFNGIAFDINILHFYFEWCSQKIDPLYELETKEIIKILYGKAQEIINMPEGERFQNMVFENDLFIPTIDLFKQKHYDRSARATGLKWIQFTMCYPNIEEMPIAHNQPITIDDIPQVLEYCWNDVDSTYEFFNRIKFETEVRLALSEEYGMNLVNASEPRMAREIFGKFLCNEMKISYAELRKKQTIRKFVHFEEIIFPYVKFVTPELQKVLEDVKAVTIDCNPHSKQTFAYSFDLNGVKVDLGLGGIHSCTLPGVYVPQDEEVIQDLDVVSFYPKLGIENNLKPQHLGTTFSKIYNHIFKQRLLTPKKDPKNYIFKILLNSAYGLSSEINSYFYDKQYTYAITINGQLSLLMLVEALYKSVPAVKVLQKNTDGITIIYNTEHSEVVKKICEWWERVTKLTLEYAYYKKMIIVDVNNYIGIYKDEKLPPKCKGLFETEIDYHKNPSYLIIPKALKEYFVNGKNVNDFINEHNSIYDFCGGIKKKSNFKLNLYKSIGQAEIVEEQQKVTRFIVSRPDEDSGIMMKDFADGRKISVLANTLVKPLNVIKPGYEQPNRYNLNYEWYYKEAKKIIEIISPQTIQQKLF